MLHGVQLTQADRELLYRKINMKPTEKQKHFCEQLQKIMIENISHWQTTNDITSPSHFTLIDESVDVDKLNYLSEYQVGKLRDLIGNIYYIVKTVK